jgi:hypothetical protein
MPAGTGGGDATLKQCGEWQDGAGKAAPVVERLEQRDRARHGLLGPGGVVDHVEGPRQRDQRLPERCLVAQQLPELHDLGGARRRLVEARQVVEDPDAVSDRR